MTKQLVATLVARTVHAAGRAHAAALQNWPGLGHARQPLLVSRRVNPTGAGALLGGIAAAALCVNTLYTGPVATLLGGIDISLPVGMIVAAGLYVVLSRRSVEPVG